jgi:hypothetical protein
MVGHCSGAQLRSAFLCDWNRSSLPCPLILNSEIGLQHPWLFSGHVDAVTHGDMAAQQRCELEIQLAERYSSCLSLPFSFLDEKARY